MKSTKLWKSKISLRKYDGKYKYKFFCEKTEKGTRTGEKIWKYTSMCLKQAIDDNILTYNPYDAVKRAKYEIKTVKIIPEADFIEIVNNTEAINCKLAFTLIYETGLRPQVVVGLQKQDIDFTKGYGLVKRALSYSKEDGYYWDAGKSVNANRPFPLSLPLLSFLKQYLNGCKKDTYVISNQFRGYETTET